MTRENTKPSTAEYVAFRNDKQRLWALISRDVRLVLIALITAGGLALLLWRSLDLL